MYAHVHVHAHATRAHTHTVIHLLQVAMATKDSVCTTESDHQQPGN